MERLTTSYTIGSMVPIGEDRAIGSTFTVTVDDGDEMTPVVTLACEVRDGVPQCREVRITSRDGGREVRAGDGRKLRIEDWLEGALADTAMPVTSRDAGSSTLSAPRNHNRGETVRQVRVVRRQARRRVTDELLSEVAEVYRANVDDGPTAAVAARFVKSHRTAGLYVKQAREAGLLGQAVKGRAGEQ